MKYPGPGFNWVAISIFGLANLALPSVGWSVPGSDEYVPRKFSFIKRYANSGRTPVWSRRGEDKAFATNISELGPEDRANAIRAQKFLENYFIDRTNAREQGNFVRNLDRVVYVPESEKAKFPLDEKSGIAAVYRPEGKTLYVLLSADKLKKGLKNSIPGSLGNDIAKAIPVDQLRGKSAPSVVLPAIAQNQLKQLEESKVAGPAAPSAPAAAPGERRSTEEVLSAQDQPAPETAPPAPPSESPAAPAETAPMLGPDRQTLVDATAVAPAAPASAPVLAPPAASFSLTASSEQSEDGDLALPGDITSLGSGFSSLENDLHQLRNSPAISGAPAAAPDDAQAKATAQAPAQPAELASQAKKTSPPPAADIEKASSAELAEMLKKEERNFKSIGLGTLDNPLSGSALEKKQASSARIKQIKERQAQLKGSAAPSASTESALRSNAPLIELPASVQDSPSGQAPSKGLITKSAQVPSSAAAPEAPAQSTVSPPMAPPGAAVAAPAARPDSLTANAQGVPAVDAEPASTTPLPPLKIEPPLLQAAYDAQRAGKGKPAQAQSASPSEFKIEESEARRIAAKIFANEGGGKDDKLAEWDLDASGKPEKVVSIGMGHFIWYPTGDKTPFHESFPDFMDYVKKSGFPAKDIPEFLRKSPLGDSPWKTREQFQAYWAKRNQKGSEANQFFTFLKATKEQQKNFMPQRLVLALPNVFAATSLSGGDAKTQLPKVVADLMSSPAGRFAMVDYVNFKGDGSSPSENLNGVRFGLLQVFERLAEKKAKSPNAKITSKDFGTAANEVLSKRPDYSKWPGWPGRMLGY
jgi:hypothetical protein